MCYKYIRQKNNYSCGPIALYNLLTWANAHDSMSYRDIYKLTKCDSTHGTKTLHFTAALEKLTHESINLKTINNFKKFNQLQKILLENKNLCAIIEYEQRESYLHFVLVFSKNKKLFIVNQHANKHFLLVVQKIENLDFIMNFNTKKHHPLVWMIIQKQY